MTEKTRLNYPRVVENNIAGWQGVRQIAEARVSDLLFGAVVY